MQGLQSVPAELLTPDDVARRFGCSPRTVRKWVQEGKLRGFRAGRLVRVYADSVVDVLRRGALLSEDGGTHEGSHRPPR